MSNLLQNNISVKIVALTDYKLIRLLYYTNQIFPDNYYKRFGFNISIKVHIWEL